MSLSDVIAGLHERFDTLGTIPVMLDYEPRAIAKAPLLYSLLDSAQREVRGNVVVWTYRIRSTLCILWVDREAAEAAVQTYTDALPAAVDAAPRLGGRAKDAFVAQVDAGWRVINQVEYRVIDLYTDVLVYAPLGAGA